MKFKHLAIAGLSAAVSAGALANDVVTGGVLTDGTSGFTITHFDSLPFMDEITFTSMGDVFATASIITINLGSGQNIDFTSVTLNDVPLTVESLNSFVDVAYTASALTLSGDLVLKVMGTTDAGAGRNATYSGTINVSAIPEPETYALMLAGLGAIGFMARRRRGA